MPHVYKPATSVVHAVYVDVSTTHEPPMSGEAVMTFIYYEITYTQRERGRKGNKYEQVEQQGCNQGHLVVC